MLSRPTANFLLDNNLLEVNNCISSSRRVLCPSNLEWWWKSVVQILYVPVKLVDPDSQFSGETLPSSQIQPIIGARARLHRSVKFTRFWGQKPSTPFYRNSTLMLLQLTL